MLGVPTLEYEDALQAEDPRIWPSFPRAAWAAQVRYSFSLHASLLDLGVATELSGVL